MTLLTSPIIGAVIEAQIKLSCLILIFADIETLVSFVLNFIFVLIDIQFSVNFFLLNFSITDYILTLSIIDDLVTSLFKLQEVIIKKTNKNIFLLG